MLLFSFEWLFLKGASFISSGCFCGCENFCSFILLFWNIGFHSTSVSYLNVVSLAGLW